MKSATEIENWVKEELKLNNQFESAFTSSQLKELVQCVDLTSLNSTDSVESVKAFVASGIKTITASNISPFAAVCVFSNFTEVVKSALSGTSISTACVAAAFPHGQADLKVKVAEVKSAAMNGADDIDIVINRGLVLDGKMNEMAAEVSAFKSAAGSAHLKVILEVCDLSLEQVYVSSKLALNAGADFLKTSTGKGSHGATLEASLLMCLAIKEHFEKTGKMVGFKAAGGISTSGEAIKYYNLVHHILGKEWVNNRYFRIGASSLLAQLINDIKA